MPRITGPSAFLACVAIACLAAPLGSQRTIVASGGGDDLQRAVDQARSGDSVEVRAGSYTAVVIRRGIHVRCDAGVAVVGTYFPAEPGVAILGVPDGEVCSWTGGQLSASPFGRTHAALWISDCRGLVRIAGPVTVSGPGDPSANPEVAIDGNPGRVLFEQVQLGNGFVRSFRSQQVAFQNGSLGEFWCDTSHVALIDTDTRHIRFQSGFLSVTGGLVQGGRTTYPPLVGRPAIRLGSGRLVLNGRARLLAIGPGEPPCVESLGGSIRVAPDVVLDTPASRPFQGPARILREPVPSLRAHPDTPLGTLRLTVGAPPGTSCAVVVDAGSDAPTWTPFGLWWLDSSAHLFDRGRADALGRRILQVPMPPVSGLVIRLQVVSEGPSGRPLLGNVVQLPFD